MDKLKRRPPLITAKWPEWENGKTKVGRFRVHVFLQEVAFWGYTIHFGKPHIVSNISKRLHLNTEKEAKDAAIAALKEIIKEASDCLPN